MRPFEIDFDFPVASSNLKIPLMATAEIHHSDPYYVVHDFYVANNKNNKAHHSVLPDQQIKRIRRNGTFTWVHKDSEKESELSIAIGTAIENALTKEELNKNEDKADRPSNL
jgi:hypothetical protein